MLTQALGNTTKKLIHTDKCSDPCQIKSSTTKLATGSLFAWTIALIVLSFCVEKLILKGTALLLNPVKGYRNIYLQKKYKSVSEDGNRDTGRYAAETDEGAAGTNAVVLSHIYKSFGEKEVLSDVNMEIKKGGRYMLMGPSGSGKTTLLRIIAGLEQADRKEGSGQGAPSFHPAAQCICRQKKTAFRQNLPKPFSIFIVGQHNVCYGKFFFQQPVFLKQKCVFRFPFYLTAVSLSGRVYCGKDGNSPGGGRNQCNQRGFERSGRKNQCPFGEAGNV